MGTRSGSNPAVQSSSTTLKEGVTKIRNQRVEVIQVEDGVAIGKVNGSGLISNPEEAATKAFEIRGMLQKVFAGTKFTVVPESEIDETTEHLAMQGKEMTIDDLEVMPADSYAIKWKQGPSFDDVKGVIGRKKNLHMQMTPLKKIIPKKDQLEDLDDMYDEYALDTQSGDFSIPPTDELGEVLDENIDLWDRLEVKSNEYDDGYYTPARITADPYYSTPAEGEAWTGTALVFVYTKEPKKLQKWLKKAGIDSIEQPGRLSLSWTWERNGAEIDADLREEAELQKWEAQREEG